ALVYPAASGSTLVLASQSSRPCTVFAGGRGLHRSDDQGLTWQPLKNELHGGYVSALAFHPLDPERLWVGLTDGSVWVRESRTRDFRKAFDGLPPITHLVCT